MFYSFHETKNYTMGEGGALLFQEDKYQEKAEILREKGINRSKFFRGQVDKYTWVDFGSSYLPSDLNAAYLYAQLELCKEINNKRMAIWNLYNEAFASLEEKHLVERPFVPDYAVHNAHMYYLKLKDLEPEQAYPLYERKWGAVCFPLHSASYSNSWSEVWTISWGGPLYDQRKRKTGTTANVL
ncbi:MAG: DegT/DnrJ/EryC1/StrS family aminotransferase [Lachnospiraceae bacterium]